MRCSLFPLSRFHVGSLALAAFVAVAPFSRGEIHRGNPTRANATNTVDRARSAAGTEASVSAKPIELPPLPAGVAELKFSEFFQQPVGPRGLELTEKLRRLDGRRVRILGYMVDQSQPAPHGLLLSPRPVKLHEDEWGFCEDLPAAILHVLVDPSEPATVPFTPGPLLLTGTLSVGNREEPDQRVSTVRLQLDPPAKSAASASRAPAIATHSP